jgi:hypothetical protein
VKKRKHKAHTSLLKHAFDFIFITSVGVCYFLLLYAFTDGVFFACTLAALFLGFMLTRKALAAGFLFLKNRKR